MPQSLANVLVHLVFSTKNREPTIASDFRADVHSFMGGILQHNGCRPMGVGGVEDHVHLLFAISRTNSIAEISQQLKNGSALWSKRSLPISLKWQAGYGAFSVGSAEVDRVRNYILKQEEHHRTVDFKTEYRLLLQEAGIDYDERYMWD